MTLRADLLFLLLLVAACESRREATPLVVYLGGAEDGEMQERFARYSRATGVAVNSVYGDSAANAGAVIGNRTSPAADVLIADSVADIWLAADEGALRPLQGEGLAAVPATLRDPDRLWAAVAVRYAEIRAAPNVAPADALQYADLARPEFSGRLCLTTSSLPLNRALVAMLIEDRGVKPAERLVRAWIHNLARPVFDSNAALIDAIARGECAYGFVSVAGDAVSPESGVGVVRYLDVTAVGVARHAPRADTAQGFVDWLLTQYPPTEPLWSNGRNIGIAGWRSEDARLLMERAGYR